MKKIFTIALFSVATSLFATTHNVPANFSTIQAALNAAATGDTITVDPGTYNENLTWPATQSIKLFSLGDSSNTIIDGSGTGRVLLFPNNSATDTTTVVRGFKLTNGYTTDQDAGAGLKLISSSPLIDAVAIVNNFGNGNRVYGAGVHITGGKPVFRNSCVNYNDGIPTGGNYFYGGACYIDGNADVIIANCEFSHNNMGSTARAYGAGIYITGADADIQNSFFNDNNTQATTYNYGGALYVYNGSNVTVSGSDLGNNNLLGGRAYGGSVYVGFNSLLNAHDSKLNDNILNNTSRASGGSVYISGNDAVANFYRCEMNNNKLSPTSFCYGGGIYMSSGAKMYLENSLIANNELGGSASFYDGGGIYMDGDTLIALHTTVADNYRVGNQDIDGTGIALSFSAEYANFRSSILYNDNTGNEIDVSSGTLVITYSDIRNGYTGTGNINALPDFVGSGDYHITSSSPCKEAGDPNNFPSDDLDKSPRPLPVNTDPDMGAYESASPFPTAAVCCNDTICDGDSILLDGVVSGGQPPYLYSWTPSGSLNNATVQDPMAGPASTTTYELIITDNNNNKDTATVTIYVIAGAFANAGTDTSVCGTECTNLNASGTGSFTWAPSSGLSCTNCPNPIACPTANTTYYLTTDTAGCESTDSVTVTVNPLPTAEAGVDTVICAGGCTELNATGGASYDWSPSTGLSCTNCQDPTACPGDTTTYYVTVTDGNGCTAVDSVTVNVDPCASIGENYNNIAVETYPNPFDNQVVFNLGNTNAGIIEIIDQHGRIVLTEKVNSNTTTIDTGNLGAGIYHYKVSTEKGDAVGKLVKL